MRRCARVPWRAFVRLWRSLPIHHWDPFQLQVTELARQGNPLGASISFSLQRMHLNLHHATI